MKYRVVMIFNIKKFDVDLQKSTLGPKTYSTCVIAENATSAIMRATAYTIKKILRTLNVEDACAIKVLSVRKIDDNEVSAN